MIRLYGHMAGSFRTVTLGMLQALEDLLLMSGFVPGESTEFELDVPGATAPIAVVVGDPMRVLQTHIHGDHKQTWLMLAPNSNGVPPKLRDELSKDTNSPSKGRRVPVVDGFLAPSSWAQEVLKREFPNHPVRLCRHGVISAFRCQPELWERREQLPFRALHVTSSKLSRKCTRELIRAWKRLKTDSTLDVLANPEFAPKFQEMVNAEGAQHVVQVIPGGRIPYDQYVKTLHLYSLVVQPSRAEGFGLVPLEARACGVPVVMTNNTGHQDHFDPLSCEIVQSGPDQESDDYWGATAPTVSEDDILDGLKRARLRLPALKEEAMAFAKSHEKWTWTNQVRETMKELVNVQSEQ